MPKITKKAKRRRACLSKRDRADLEASGLTDVTIRLNRLRTENKALVFPYRDLDGKVNCFARTKPHHPRDKDGKPVKYEQPKGSTPRAYFPASSIMKLHDGDAPIYITEGEKKSLALSQLKLAAIGIGGAWCCMNKGTDVLIDDLAAIDWSDRTVYIVFDYDEKPKTRKHVKDAAKRLAKALQLGLGNPRSRSHRSKLVLFPARRPAGVLDQRKYSCRTRTIAAVNRISPTVANHRIQTASKPRINSGGVLWTTPA